MTQLLRKTLPVITAHAPGVVLARDHANVAIDAIRDAASYSNIKGLTLVDGLDMLTDPSQNLASTRVFEENVNRLRGELYVGGHDDALRRFEIHQLLMVAGFYARAANQHSTKIDPIRFVSNHYNFDVRRDKVILGSVKDAVFGEAKAASNAVLGDLLITERHLFGQHRLQPISGRQYMMPGVSLRLVKTEEELKRLLELEPVAKHGNFEMVLERDDLRVQTVNSGGWTRNAQIFVTQEKVQKQERWDVCVLRCKAEPEVPVAPPMKIYTGTEAEFRLRVLRPPPPMSFIERMKETLLQLWVYWFSFWVLFWMVDEEVITLVGLILARYQQLSMLKEEAKRTGGKVYIATSRFN